MKVAPVAAVRVCLRLLPSQVRTAEGVEGDCCCLPLVRLIGANEGDDLAGLLELIVVALKVAEDLTGTVVQWHSACCRGKGKRSQG